MISTIRQMANTKHVVAKTNDEMYLLFTEYSFNIVKKDTKLVEVYSGSEADCHEYIMNNLKDIIGGLGN